MHLREPAKVSLREKCAVESTTILANLELGPYREVVGALASRSMSQRRGGRCAAEALEAGLGSVCTFSISQLRYYIVFAQKP